MALAALIVSILALIVSLVGAVFSARNAAAAERSAEAARLMSGIDEQRRHEERAPRFEARVERGGQDVLRLVLLTPEPLDGVTVTIMHDLGVVFTGSQEGVEGPGDSVIATCPTGLAAGGHHVWRVRVRYDARMKEMPLLVRSRRGGDSWEQIVLTGTPR